MTGIKPHIIEKQFVELNLTGDSDVFSFNNELEKLCRDELIPEIEKLLDRIVPDDILIRIENLEIDTGTISHDSWKKDFIEKVMGGISAEIKTLPDKRNFNIAETGLLINEEENYKNIFLFFLRNGFLPWYSGIKSRSDLYSVTDKIMNSGDENFFRRLKDTLKNNIKSLDRLIYQFEESELNRISLLIFRGKSTDRLLKILNPALNSLNLKHEKKKEILYRNWFEILLNSKAGLSETILLKKTSYEILNMLKNEYDQELAGKFTESLTENLKNDIGPEEIIYITEEVNRNTEISGDESDIILPESEQISDSEWYITNSGLVLLHPFLVKLFERTGYIKNNEWASEDIRKRAVLLTQFAVTGEEEYPEFLLILNKVLCGYEIPDSLPADIKLSEFEKNETEELLSSVIGHWTAIKNTTLNGLRETFLMRSGKLTRDSSGWLLQVEVKTVDILINKLPWGISMIKLPWMKEMLRVEWLY